MNPSARDSSPVAAPFANPPALTRIERTFSNLAALVQARSARRAALLAASRKNPARLTRSEAFRQVQHEKWLGKRPTAGAGAAASPRPKDLYRRPLQDPHA